MKRLFTVFTASLYLFTQLCGSISVTGTAADGHTTYLVKEFGGEQSVSSGDADYQNLCPNDYIEHELDTNAPVVDSVATYGLLQEGSIPSKYGYDVSDLSEKFPGTRNQNPYGSCWAHSAIGLTEFCAISKGYADKTIDLSELQLTYFTLHPVTDPLGGTHGDINAGSDSTDPDSNYNYLNMGGTYYFSSRAMASWIGAADESLMPYSEEGAADLLVNPPDSEYARGYNRFLLENTYLINMDGNPEAVKRFIMEYGGVGASYYSDNQYYSVVDSPYSEESKVTVYYDKVHDKSNHAVMLVGWDDDFPAELFPEGNRPEGNGAWFVRNSWTTETGNSRYSYFWLSYYDLSLRSTAWVFDVNRAGAYDNNYQYDGMINAAASAYSCAANVFTTQKKEEIAAESLEAVSFSVTRYAQVDYRIEIYTDLTDPTDPCSGRLVEEAVTEGQTSYAGYYTIPLENPVVMLPETTFSVVISLSDNTGQERWIGMDLEKIYPLSDSYDVQLQVHADEGESFAKNVLTGKWQDIVPLQSGQNTGNVCIKAFTKNLAPGDNRVPIPTPTAEPTAKPTQSPTPGPTTSPTTGPTAGPTTVPTTGPTAGPTTPPTTGPTGPSPVPTADPTASPTAQPTISPSPAPTVFPTPVPTVEPTATPAVTYYQVVFKDGNKTVKTESVLQGSDAVPPVLQKKGYRLSWDVNYKNVRKNLTVRSKWTPITYSIRFYGNGGTGSVSTMKNRKYGSSYALNSNKFTRKGYTFVGWNTKKNGTGTSFRNRARIRNLTSVDKTTVKLYAQWKKNVYKISYRLSGGKNHKQNPKQYNVTTATIRLKNPTRAGYTFVGWYKEAAYRTRVTSIQKGSTGNLVLYAKWKKEKGDT